MRIARLAAGDPPEQLLPRILEVGPGTGALTSALCALGAQVTALDVDPDMIAVLRGREDLRGAQIVQADALTFDYTAFADGRPWRVAGNLPYNIATPLVIRLVAMHGGPQSLTVMLQKDVVERLAARPATPAYGSLSVAVQYAMRVERAFTLGPGAFHPRPKIDSAVVQLIRRDRPAIAVADEAQFLQVVRAGFAYRRKTLANSLNLALGLDRARVRGALTELSLDTEIRGEQLSLAEFGRLADTLRQ